MAHILSVLEEGCTRLFLVADQGPSGERRFAWAGNELEVCTEEGETLWRVPLGTLERTLVNEGRAHWMEFRGEQKLVDLVIVLAS
jgi:hypothetical protein